MIILSVSAGVLSGAEKQSAAKGDFPPADKLPEIKELPDPFLMKSGKRVKTLKDWKKRREEIKAMLLHYQFGSMPPPPGNVTAEITSKQDHRMAVKLTMGPEKKLEMGVRIWFAKGKGPFPVIVRPKHYSGGRPSESSKRGYMEARYDNCALEPDPQNREDVAGPAQAAYPEHDWATIAVWAWGGMRVIDYLMTLEEVDREKIIVTGHSRGGATALLIGALDERVALTAPNAGACGGAACYRFVRKGFQGHRGIHRYGALNWFHARRLQFKGKISRLPFDGHFHKALVAPRALFMTNGLNDKNSDALAVQHTSLAAKVVFEWLGAGNRIGWWFRPGGHAQGKEDWAAMLDYADWVFFGKKPESSRQFDKLPFPDEKPPFSWKAPERIESEK